MTNEEIGLLIAIIVCIITALTYVNHLLRTYHTKESSTTNINKARRDQFYNVYEPLYKLLCIPNINHETYIESLKEKYTSLYSPFYIERKLSFEEEKLYEKISCMKNILMNNKEYNLTQLNELSEELILQFKANTNYKETLGKIENHIQDQYNKLSKKLKLSTKVK